MKQFKQKEASGRYGAYSDSGLTTILFHLSGKAVCWD